MFTDAFRPGHALTDRANDWRAGIEPAAMEQALRLTTGNGPHMRRIYHAWVSLEK